MKHLLLAATLLTLFNAPAFAAPPTTRPANVIVILSDDQGYGDLSAYGATDIPTPNIDSIGKNGIRFTDAYVSAPQCTPSRAGLMTGRYQTRFGYEVNTAHPDSGLPTTETTFAARMKSVGYATGMIGKWHLGHADKYHPCNRGFDEFFGFLGGGNSYLPRGASGVPGISRNKEEATVTEYLTTAFGNEASAFITRHAAHPFFLYLAFNAPHVPLEATPEYLARFASIKDPKRRTYAAMVSAMDDAVGNVLACLRKLNLEEETLVFFLSDNGGPQGNSWNGSSNAPFRGWKGTTFEGGIRVPFMAQWKGSIPAGNVSPKPIISLDLLPTALAAAGAKVDPAWKLDGVNILPLLKDPTTPAPHDVLLWRFTFRPNARMWAIRQGDFKLKGSGTGNTEALYNLPADLHEDTDTKTDNPAQTAELLARWKDWNAELIEPLWNHVSPGKNRKNANED